MRTTRLLISSVLALMLAGCASMSPGEQRLLSGGAIGAGAGAAIGAIAGGNPAVGAAIGGAAGVAGGAIINQMKENEGHPQY